MQLLINLFDCSDVGWKACWNATIDKPIRYSLTWSVWLPFGTGRANLQSITTLYCCGFFHVASPPPFCITLQKVSLIVPAELLVLWIRELTLMTIELLSQLITVIVYAALFLYPISAFFVGTRIQVGKLSVIAGLGAMIFFIILIGGAYEVQGRWVMDRLNCHELSTVDCTEISPSERAKLMHIFNDKGRDFAVVFGVLVSIPYGLVVSVFIIISRLIQNKLLQSTRQNRATE